MWGAQDENGTWNGIVRDLQEKVGLLLDHDHKRELNGCIQYNSGMW